MAVSAGCSSTSDDSATPSDVDPNSSTATTEDASQRGSGDADDDPTEGSSDPADSPDASDAPESTEPTDGPEQPAVDLTALSDVPGRLLIRTNDGTIATVAPDGTRLDALTATGAGFHSQPTWSLEADRAAWTTIDADGPAIVIWSEGDGAMREIDVSTPPFFYSWSPGGDALGSLRPTGAGVELGLVADGGPYMPVGGGQPFYFDWNSDGTSLVAAVSGSTLARIRPGDPPEVEEVDTGEALGVFQSPSVLADGRVVLPLRTGVGPAFDLTILDIDSGLAEVIASGRGTTFLSANPTDSRVAVLSGIGGSADDDVQLVAFQNDVVEMSSGVVTIIDRDDGSVVALPESDVVAFNWSPDGQRLALLRRLPNGFQWVFTDGVLATEGPAYFPSSEFGNAYLPFSDQYNQNLTWWSPDSSAFVYAGRVGDQSGVYVDLVADERGPAMIIEGDIASWSPR